MTPPLTARILVDRAASVSFLATGAGSSAMKAIAVGPSRNSIRLGRSACSAASFASVFFATRNDAPASRSERRSSASRGTRPKRPQVAQTQKRRQSRTSLRRKLARSPLPKREVAQSHKLKQPKLKLKLKLKRRSSNGR